MTKNSNAMTQRIIWAVVFASFVAALAAFWFNGLGIAAVLLGCISAAALWCAVATPKQLNDLVAIFLDH